MSSDLLRHAPTWLKTRWARVLGGTLAICVLLVIATPYLLDADRYRDRIADAISLQIGRKVTLGKIHAAILPRLGFTVDGCQVANPPDFAQGQMVLAEQVTGALAVWPLILRREIRIVSLELIDPRLTLLVDDRGRNNYSLPARRPASSASSRPVPITNDLNPSIALMVDQVTMKDAAIFYGRVDRRGRSETTIHASNLNLELHQIVLRPLRIREWQADANLGGTQLDISGWNTPVLFQSGSVTLRDGRLLSSFTARLGSVATLEGSVTVPKVEDAVPQFDLRTNDVDLTALLAATSDAFPTRAGNVNPAPLAATGNSFSTRTAAAGKPLAAMAPPESSSRLLAQVHVAADRLRYAGATAGPLSMDVRVFTDRAEIWPFTLRLADGAVQLTARTDRRQVPQRFSANIQVRDVSAERILQNVSGLRGKLAGSMEIDAHLVGSMENHWTESLTGSGRFTIRNGRFAGFDLTGAAQSIANMAGVNGSTPFTRLAGDLNVHDERIASRQIHMESPRGTLDLKGYCGFYGSLGYEGQMIIPLTGTPSQSGGGAGDILSGILGGSAARNMGPTQITVPFILRGTVQQPQLRAGRTGPKFTRTALRTQTDPSPSAPPAESFSFPSLFGR